MTEKIQFGRISAWRDEHGSWWVQEIFERVAPMQPLGILVSDSLDEIERLRAERDALKQDAERYRWLRRARMNVDVLVREDEDSVWLDMHGWDLDAYVDAALAAGGE